MRFSPAIASAPSRAVPSLVQGKGAAGFTLLEALLAVTIFSMIMLSIFTLMGTSAQTLERTTRKQEDLLRARGVFDTLGRDFRNFFYENESDYNTNARQTIERLDRELGEQAADDLSGQPRGNDTVQSNLGEEDDDFLLPIEIDLAIVASDGGDTDEISFTTYEPNQPGGFFMPWGVRRVQYMVREEVLYRVEDTVFKEDVDGEGVVVAKALPEPERICDHIALFDLKYSYWDWEAGDWLLAPDWNSGASNYRFPSIGGTAEELGISQEELNQIQQQQLPDDAPSMVEVTLGVRDPKREGYVRIYRKSFRLPQASETSFEPEYAERLREGASRGRRATTSPSGGGGVPRNRPASTQERPR